MSGYAQAVREATAQIGAWRDLPFFQTDMFGKVVTALATETADILPPPDAVFRALELTQPSDVRAVILGQDPYPTPGHAMGLAFSTAPDVRPLPRSLGNIYKEMQEDLGHIPDTGDLSAWARNGVLLLNSSLTVRTGDAGSHARLGWAVLVDQIIADIANRDGIAWVLWGKHAQAKRPLIEAGRGAQRLVIESPHPSPLSARRGFFGSRPFSQIEDHLGRRVFAKM